MTGQDERRVLRELWQLCERLAPDELARRLDADLIAQVIECGPALALWMRQLVQAVEQEA